MTDATSIYERNRTIYAAPDVVEIYADLSEGLLKGEQFILTYLGDEIRGKTLLDIGIGGGRTTPFLHALSKKYIGIDYSEAMIERARSLHPGVDLRHGDAMQMDGFEDGTFDVVFFSFNGIDHARLEGRLRMLAEIHRVLKKGGLFLFSSHNRDRPQRLPYRLPRLRTTGALPERARFALQRLWNYPKGIINYWRLRRYEVHAEDHAFLVDQAHEFRMLMYYTTMPHQVAQLEHMQFSDIEMVGVDGTLLDIHAQRNDGWIYYIARKG